MPRMYPQSQFLVNVILFPINLNGGGAFVIELRLCYATISTVASASGNQFWLISH